MTTSINLDAPHTNASMPILAAWLASATGPTASEHPSIAQVAASA